MAFESWAAFLAMEGHGPYVWSCYAVFVVLLAGLMIWSVGRKKAVIAVCRRGYEFQADESKVAASAAPASFARVDVSRD